MLEKIFQSEEFRKAKEKVETTNYLAENRQFHDRRHYLDGYAVFYPIIDCTPAARLYHQQLIRKNGLSHETTSSPREVCIDDGWLFLIVEKNHPLDSVNQNFSCKDYCNNLFRKEDKLRKKLEYLLSKSNDMDPEEYASLFNHMTTYGSLVLDGVASPNVPKFILDKRGEKYSESEKEKLASDFLYPSREVIYMYITYSALLKLAIDYTKENLTNSATQNFIETIGYLDRTDITPCNLEKKDFITNWIKKKASQNSAASLEEERYGIFRQRASARFAQARARNKILGVYPAKDENYQDAKNHLNFLECSINYNESNRKLRTKFFKFTQQWMENQGLDIKNDNLPEECYMLPTPESVSGCFR